ncbi:MAG: acetylglutamate kinase [Chloroflexi bacterium]|nr:acetylglutamate kinase [Chloroflexota bacterium]
MSDNARPLVVKIGGSTLGSADTSFQDLVTLQRQGRTPVVVHGGGPLITQWMQKQGLVPRFIRGLRVTDPPSLEIVVAVLTGLINKQLVGAITALGGEVVGLSGADGAILQAAIANEELGLVGEVVKVNPDPVVDLVERGYIPLIAPIGIRLPQTPGESCTLLNINGDTAAGHLALALGAERLVFLTDVEGVMDSERRVFPRLSVAGANALIAAGTAAGGMIPKLEACVKALERVPAARILDGRVPGALLRALGEGPEGTWVVA